MQSVKRLPLMSILSNYLIKYSFRERLLSVEANRKVGMIVVIPAHDEPDVVGSIASLQECELPNCSVEVIVVFNASEDSSKEVIQLNKKAKEELEHWFKSLVEPKFDLFCIEENELPKKHAGVGLARKIGMDEAVRRFEAINRKEGVIVCFDADAKCEVNYLIEIEKHFQKYPSIGACSIHFEHPTGGNDFPEQVYQGIVNYELHLRYYKNGLAFAKLPYAFHTIGSSMAVRASAYCEQGGMNRRKAGEDFYFLQKFIAVGTLNELKTTKVIPSPRASHRVPFGTGRAIQEMLDEEREIEKSYAFECFEIIKESFKNVREFYRSKETPSSLLLEFVGEENWKSKLAELRKQSTTEERFETRFFQWFNAFQTLKFIHFLRDNYYPNESLEQEVPKLLRALDVESTTRNLLSELRRLDQT